jgi:hypothetical protein
MLLLAAEAASATQGTTASAAGLPWLWAFVVVGTLASSFAGAYLGLRSFSISHVRADGDWREVTYRFKAKGPLKYGTSMLEVLNGAVGELERMTPKARSQRRAKTAPEPVTPAADAALDTLAAATPMAGTSENRSEAYQRARRLLAAGNDAWTVRELTGLKLAELDLLTSTGAGSPPVKPETVGAKS